MFGDIGWAELLLIGIVALIVIGPEDLPDMFRQFGRFTAKLRQMSREFSRAMEQAAKDSGVKDVADDLRQAASAKSMGIDKVRAAADRFEKWDPMKSAGLKPTPASSFTTPAAPTSATTTAPAADTDAPTAAPAADTAAAPRPLGPETQAMADRQAAKKAILGEAAEKLKALSAEGAPAPAAAPAAQPAKRAVTRKAPAASAAAKPAAKPAAKSTAKAAAKPAAASTADAPAKPRAPRKKKADEA